MMTEALPSREECINLLKNSGCGKNVIKHSLAVEELAIKIAELANADKKLVSIAALLHDTGRGKTHGIKHAVEGGKIARELGLPESVIHIIERHIGAGISKEEAQELDLPVKEYMPVTLEEKIVAHADNLIEDYKKRPVKEVVQRFSELGYKKVAEKVKKLHIELSEICGIDLDLL